jgi:hypothetical protein
VLATASSSLPNRQTVKQSMTLEHNRSSCYYSQARMIQ